MHWCGHSLPFKFKQAPSATSWTSKTSCSPPEDSSATKRSFSSTAIFASFLLNFRILVWILESLQSETKISDPMSEDTISVVSFGSCSSVQTGRRYQGNESYKYKDESACGYQVGHLIYETMEDVDMGAGCLQARSNSRNNHQLTGDVNSVKRDALTNKSDCRFMILIDHLEKDLTPSAIENFIFKHTSIHSKACIRPSLISEPYTRGYIIVEDAVKFQKVQSFILKSGQMIISSKGRPWIVADHEKYESSDSAISSMEVYSMCMEASDGGQLKIIQSGSSEYSRAEQLRNMYVEFAEHLAGLWGRLALEEERVVAKSIDSD